MPELAHHQVEGELSIVSLNRADRRNAVNLPLLDALNKALKQAADEPATRLVLLRAEGEHFSVGDDLTDFDQGETALSHARAVIEGFQTITRRIMGGTKLHLCAVQGWAVGGAFAWPVNCDLSIWADDARALLPEAGHGLFISGALTRLLPARCGRSRALDLALSGKPIAVERLLALGLADRTAPAEDLNREARAWAEQLLSLAPRSLPAYRRLVSDLDADAIEQALAAETAEALAAVADPDLLVRMANWRSRKPDVRDE